jgi:hypothetical protein
MGHCVDQEMAQSRRGPDLEIEATRQAIYIKFVQCGINYNNKQVLWSAMVQGYAEAINNLFKLRSFSPPADLSDPNNMTAILLNNMLREEDIARQCAPLDYKIFAKLGQTAIASKCKDSVSELLFDIVALGHYIRPRLSLPRTLATYAAATTMVA